MDVEVNETRTTVFQQRGDALFFEQSPPKPRDAPHHLMTSLTSLHRAHQQFRTNALHPRPQDPRVHSGQSHRQLPCINGTENKASLLYLPPAPDDLAAGSGLSTQSSVVSKENTAPVARRWLGQISTARARPRALRTP